MANETIDFGVTDDEFWSDPLKNRQQIEDRLYEIGGSALVIGAPAAVHVQLRGSLPVAVFRAGKMMDLAQARFQDHAVLTAIDLSTDTVYAYMAVVVDAPRPPAYNGRPVSGWRGQTFVIDARRQLGLPWTTGRTFLLCLLLRDQVTNRVRVELKKGGFEDPAVIEYLRHRDREPQAVEIWPPAGEMDRDLFGPKPLSLPSYQRRPDSLPIPEETGVVIKAPRIVEMVDPVQCVVHGSFRLSVQPRHIVPPDVEGSHTAVVPITLVLTGSDSGVPILFPLRIPSYDPVAAEGGVVTGYFTLDLRTLKDFIYMEETFFIYAFSGEAMTGPTAMALVR